MADLVEQDLRIELPEQGSWPESVHLLEQRAQWAIHAALAAQRPLLLEGEPGCGKSHFARAAAVLLERAFVATVVHARSTVEDLQYHFDVVARLAEAQTLAARGLAERAEERLDPRRFLRPGPLWWVFGPLTARDHLQTFQASSGDPWNAPGFHAPADWQPQRGAVLLIDEIDKAESDLPNGLLEILGNGAFSVPHLPYTIGLEPDVEKPLVVITTNAERELPQAFRRRCLVLRLDPPEDPNRYRAWLLRLGEQHYGAACDPRARESAAARLLEQRQIARDAGLPKPGTAEYLDLLRALVRLAPGDAARQAELLAQIEEFTLAKYSERD